MEIPKWILERLCYYDIRHPDYEMDDDAPKPMENCYCDNCFYGRSKLAEEIVKLYEIINNDRKS